MFEIVLLPICFSLPATISQKKMNALLFEFSHVAQENFFLCWGTLVVGIFALISLSVFLWWLTEKSIDRAVLGSKTRLLNHMQSDKLFAEKILSRAKELLPQPPVPRQTAPMQPVPAKPPATPTNHDLAISVANDLNSLERNLRKMDETVRGFKQGSRVAKNIREHLADAGYEVVEMIGKPFHEGMRCEIEIQEDESLPEGTSLISDIKKPQVNFAGKMIQCAKIKVSQN